MAVRYYEQEVKSGLRDRRKLSAFLQRVIRGLKPGLKKVDLTFVLCGDEYLLEINKEFLQHETYTDIITFDMSTKPEAMEGEIYISVERVRENAARFRSGYEQELHRVIFHGALHLCGFKDKKSTDKAEMREAEEECLRQYFN